MDSVHQILARIRALGQQPLDSVTLASFIQAEEQNLLYLMRTSGQLLLFPDSVWATSDTVMTWPPPDSTRPASLYTSAYLDSLGVDTLLAIDPPGCMTWGNGNGGCYDGSMAFMDILQNFKLTYSVGNQSRSSFLHLQFFGEDTFAFNLDLAPKYPNFNTGYGTGVPPLGEGLDHNSNLCRVANISIQTTTVNRNGIKLAISSDPFCNPAPPSERTSCSKFNPEYCSSTQVTDSSTQFMESLQAITLPTTYAGFAAWADSSAKNALFTFKNMDHLIMLPDSVWVNREYKPESSIIFDATTGVRFETPNSTTTGWLYNAYKSGYWIKNLDSLMLIGRATPSNYWPDTQYPPYGPELCLVLRPTQDSTISTADLTRDTTDIYGTQCQIGALTDFQLLRIPSCYFKDGYQEIQWHMKGSSIDTTADTTQTRHYPVCNF
jgi:hypothetical protein